MALWLPRGVQLVPPYEVHRDGHLSLAVGSAHGHRPGAPDRAVMAPERAMSRNFQHVEAEAVGDLLSLLGDDRDSALHLGQRRSADDLASKQQTVETVEIRNGRYQRGRRPNPGHVIDAVVARRVDQAEPCFVHLRVRPLDIRSGWKPGVPEPSALNDVLGDALLRGGAGYVLQKLTEELVVSVGIYPRSATRRT